MNDPAEYGLVVKALLDGLGGCVDWDGRSADIVRNDPALQGFTPEAIRAELIRLVRSGEARVEQRAEKRPRWQPDYRFYYKAILPLDGFRYGLFVELRLVDDDPEFPRVLLVNAHPQLP